MIYEPDDDDDEDSEIYIREMVPEEGGSFLRITNEFGEQFMIDLETRSITPL